MTRISPALRVGAALAFVGTVVLANWLVVRFGLVPAGFGLLVPAGTYAAGLSLSLRDLLHEAGGLRWVIGAIATGAALSFLLGDGRIALASGVAFLLAELFDLAVYAPLRRRAWRTAVIASNAVGAIVDTFTFLVLAGFPITFSLVAGQLLVKAVWVTLGFLVFAELIRRTVLRPSMA